MGLCFFYSCRPQYTYIGFERGGCSDFPGEILCKHPRTCLSSMPIKYTIKAGLERKKKWLK